MFCFDIDIGKTLSSNLVLLFFFSFIIVWLTGWLILLFPPDSQKCCKPVQSNPRTAWFSIRPSMHRHLPPMPIYFCGGKMRPAVTRRFEIAVASPEVEQVPDREQAPAGAAGEERHARLPRRGRQRGILVLHVAILQAEVRVDHLMGGLWK